MRVCTPITIRYAETDMMGIVYHANYLLYFEDARTRFLEAIGFPYDHIEQAGYLSPVTHFECDYGAPLRYGDTAVVRTRVVSSRPTKTVYAYEVFREGQDLDVEKPCCTGRSTHCLVDGSFPCDVPQCKLLSLPDVPKPCHHSPIPWNPPQRKSD